MVKGYSYLGLSTKEMIKVHGMYEIKIGKLKFFLKCPLIIEEDNDGNKKYSDIEINLIPQLTFSVANRGSKTSISLYLLGFNFIISYLK